MRLRLAVLLVIVAGIAGLVAVLILAPEYLFALGFPLDDAWIHAVYALSRTRWLSGHRWISKRLSDCKRSRSGRRRRTP